jgi:hypothetical protein
MGGGRRWTVVELAFAYLGWGEGLLRSLKGIRQVELPHCSRQQCTAVD